MQLSHDEFRVTLRWREPNKGSYPRPEVPGFYLTLGWANEGTAQWLLDNRMLTDDEFRAIIDGIANALDVTLHKARAMADGAADDRTARLDTLREQQQRLAKQIAMLESA